MDGQGRRRLRQKIFGDSPPNNTPQALTRVFPQARLECIKKKAVRRYKARQDVMWQRWLEGVAR